MSLKQREGWPVMTLAGAPYRKQSASQITFLFGSGFDLSRNPGQSQASGIFPGKLWPMSLCPHPLGLWTALGPPGSHTPAAWWGAARWHLGRAIKKLHFSPPHFPNCYFCPCFQTILGFHFILPQPGAPGRKSQLAQWETISPACPAIIPTRLLCTYNYKTRGQQSAPMEQSLDCSWFCFNY